MNKRIWISVITVGILAGSYNFGLAQNKASIMVSATVVARISQSVIHQAPRFSVAEEDIKRGFIEIPSGTILQIKTNSRNGYALFFEGGNELFNEVRVLEKGRSTLLSPNGGFIHQSHSGSNVEIKDLSYKIVLNRNIRPGSYPFPFTVKASLL
jgi:hypothetical protein